MYDGGGEVRGNAFANPQAVGARVFAKTQLGSTNLVQIEATAHFRDADVVVTAEGTSSVTLRWTFKMTGGFTGGGQVPWISQAYASADAFASGGAGASTDHRVDYTSWSSTQGVLDELEPPQQMEITFPSGTPLQWSRDVTVHANAGNPSCTSGAGTCSLPGIATVDADFRNTVVFSDFHLFDAESGEEIVDFTLTGAGGYDYLAADRANHCGDADYSGSTTAVDSLIALQTAVGSNACAQCRCDTDGTEPVTSADALRILRSAVALDVELLCPQC
ncbi:MAG TPA: hypothetical protein VN634_12160 [Candidatus Limnocylindrales bacterium]|nr:hypothetical protein [Candidatus Limnocylindrales bacterium]